MAIRRRGAPPAPAPTSVTPHPAGLAHARCPSSLARAARVTPGADFRDRPAMATLRGAIFRRHEAEKRTRPAGVAPKARGRVEHGRKGQRHDRAHTGRGHRCCAIGSPRASLQGGVGRRNRRVSCCDHLAQRREDAQRAPTAASADRRAPGCARPTPWQPQTVRAQHRPQQIDRRRALPHAMARAPAGAAAIREPPPTPDARGDTRPCGRPRRGPPHRADPFSLSATATRTSRRNSDPRRSPGGPASRDAEPPIHFCAAFDQNAHRRPPPKDPIEVTRGWCRPGAPGRTDPSSRTMRI